LESQIEGSKQPVPKKAESPSLWVLFGAGQRYCEGVSFGRRKVLMEFTAPKAWEESVMESKRELKSEALAC